MIRIRQLTGMGLGLLALVTACGGETRPAAAPTETTSAEMQVPAEEQLKRDIVRLQFERDAAQQQLSDQVQRNDEQAKRIVADNEMKKDRAELAHKAAYAIETAQNELKEAQKQLARASLKTRVKMEKAVSHAKEKLASVETKANQIALDHGQAWASFKTDLDTAISDLQSAVQAAQIEK